MGLFLQNVNWFGVVLYVCYHLAIFVGAGVVLYQAIRAIYRLLRQGFRALRGRKQWPDKPSLGAKGKQEP